MKRFSTSRLKIDCSRLICILCF